MLFARTSDSNGDRTGACGSSSDTGSVFAGIGKGILPFSHIAALPAEDQKHGTIDSVAVLKGVSTGDFSDALAALVGKDAPGLSAPTISRLKTVGSRSFSNGKSVIFQRNVMSISGPMVFTATFAWMINSAFWSLWVPLLMV